MAGLLGTPTLNFSDNVLPRFYLGERHHARTLTPRVIDGPMSAPYSSDAARGGNLRGTTDMLQSLKDTATSDSRPAQQTSNGAKVTGKRLCSSPMRRQHCRAKQARYRKRHQMAQKELEKNVELLRQEVNNLKRRYRDLSSRERSSQSPWSIVAEVFHLLESSFRSPWRTTSVKEMMNHPQTRLTLAVLERAFAHDAAMGDLRGVDALMEQLRLYSQCFEDPRLQLKRIESVSAGVMTAHVKLSVTVTEVTLKRVFPHLEGQHSEYNGNRLYERLLGQRLEFSCMMNFLLDDLSCRVVRLSTSIDLSAAFLRVFSNLQDVSLALEHALITPESTIAAGTEVSRCRVSNSY